jgi:asparaginyl-tRNA synthetase
MINPAIKSILIFVGGAIACYCATKIYEYKYQKEKKTEQEIKSKKCDLSLINSTDNKDSGESEKKSYTQGERVQLFDLDDSFLGSDITIWGWVQSARQQKKMTFLKVSDHWQHSMQVVCDITSKNKSGVPLFSDEEIAEIQKIQLGWAISVTGHFKLSPAKGQKYELVATKIKIMGKVKDQAGYPMAKAVSSLEHFRMYPHLETRTKEKSTIYGIRAALKKAIDEYLSSKKYIETTMPSITHSECEGGCAVFAVTRLLEDKKISKLPASFDNPDVIDFDKDFFRVFSCLTVSAQLELETQLHLGPVYTWTKAFRGEKSTGTKQLAEFSMLEIEKMCESADAIMDESEQIIKYAIRYVLEKYPEEIKYFETKFELGLIEKLTKTVQVPFIRATHANCIFILQQEQDKGRKFIEEPTFDGDLTSEHERFLVDEWFKHAVIVTRYPKKIKSFYMPVVKETDEESFGVEHVDSFDILMPGIGECVGGSMRITDSDELETRVKEAGLDQKPLEFYLETRRCGSCKHGGAGLGFERLIKFVTGVPSVRDCVAFPKYVESGKV